MARREEETLLNFSDKFDSVVRTVVLTMIETLRNLASVYDLDPNNLIRSFSVPTNLSRHPKLIDLSRLILWYGEVPRGQQAPIPRELLEIAEASWIRILHSKRGEVARLIGGVVKALGVNAREGLALVSEFLANDAPHMRSGYLLAALNTIIGV